MHANETAAHRLRFWILALAVALTGWNLIGLFGEDAGYTDALYWPDYTIQAVQAGGVLEEAGFQPGDSVVSVEGIPVVELGMYSRWPRSLARRPGQSLAIVVDRQGELVEGSVAARERPASVRSLWLGASLVALMFLWVGIWTLFRVPGVHAARLAVIGLAVGLALPGPSLGVWNGVRDHLQLLAELLWLVLLVQFFLFFPDAKRIARRRWTGAFLLAPWLVLAVCLVGELAFHPRFYHSFGGFFGLLLLGYLALLVVTLVHTSVTTPRERLRTSGMRYVLLGFAVVLLANGMALVSWLLPGFDLPGAGFMPLLIGLIPVAMALGVSHHAPELSG